MPYSIMILAWQERLPCFCSLKSWLSVERKNQSLLVRLINAELKVSLSHFLNTVSCEVNTPHQWAAFYEFIKNAYKVKREERPGVSQLSQIFKEHGIQKHGTLAVIYAHALYVLALHEGKLIYGEGFNP